MLEIKIVAFGIARDILLTSRLQIELEAGATIGTLKNHLKTQFPEFHKLSSLMFAMEEEYVDDKTRLNHRDEVVIIPPVSGG